MDIIRNLATGALIVAVAFGVVIAFRTATRSLQHPTKPKKRRSLAFPLLPARISFADTMERIRRERDEAKMSETDELESISRLESVKQVIEGIKQSYPSAKRIKIDIDFEFKEPATNTEDGDELCPVVKIEIEN